MHGTMHTCAFIGPVRLALPVCCDAYIEQAEPIVEQQLREDVLSSLLICCMVCRGKYADVPYVSDSVYMQVEASE